MQRWLLRTVSVSLALFASPAIADGTPLPDIDVDAQCSEQARSTGGGNSQLLYCLRSEQEGYNELKGKWAVTPEEIRRVCANKWRHYSMISFCVEDEIRATEEISKSKFKK